MGVKLEKARETIRMAIDLLKDISLKDLENKLLNLSTRKREQEFMEYQRPKNAVKHIFDNDKVFPLETISINSYRTDYQSDLGTAIIHTGAYANELAMRMNALAFVIGEDIYFRNGAYQPENEMGRKILAHELTHVVQYGEKRITKNADFETLEKEAELAECQAEHIPDSYEPYPINKKLYYLRRSQIEMVTKLAADGVEKWLLEQKIIMDEAGYFELLCAYQEWLDDGL
jgi:hypothetical protein